MEWSNHQYLRYQYVKYNDILYSDCHITELSSNCKTKQFNKGKVIIRCIARSRFQNNNTSFFNVYVIFITMNSPTIMRCHNTIWCLM